MKSIPVHVAVIAMLALVVGCSVASSGISEDKPSGQVSQVLGDWQTVTTTAHFTIKRSHTRMDGCDGVQRCIFSELADVVLIGTQQGNSISSSQTLLSPDFSSGVGYYNETFKGKLGACGTGEVTFGGKDTKLPTGATSALWIIPGLGTGDLEDATGSGTVVYLPDSSGGTQTLTIRCRRR